MDMILIPWVIAATLLLFLSAYWIYTVEKRVAAIETRYQKILSLAEDADQATIVQLLSRLDDQETRLIQNEARLRQLSAALPHTVRGYGLIRYSAFTGMGGNQSFSLAIVDEQGGGLVLSGLHGRDETRVYAKPLEAWHSSFSLSAEEQQALAAARQMIG